MQLKNLTFENLNRDAEGFSIIANDSYLESYPEFIAYFRNIKIIEKHHLIISSHFVYGWMPTILTLETTELDKILMLLNSVKKGHHLGIEEIKVLKHCVNNSMVGLSKLLHFINPMDYAIWDSRIYRYITGAKSQHSIAKPENYLAYLDQLREIEKHEDYNSLQERIQTHIDYAIIPMRAMELLMFEVDRFRTEGLDRFVYFSDKGLKVVKGDSLDID
jgi:hypothetical protein